MLKVEISKWEDLQGLKSTDKWSNRTEIDNVSNQSICIVTLDELLKIA